MVCYHDVVAFANELASRRDPYNHHAPRVAELVSRMADLLGMSQYEKDMLRIGANLHDIGKLFTPADILNLPRKLSRDEYAIVKVHALEGFKMMTILEYDPIILDIALHHHENYDGTGYPDRLSGDDITVYSRIVRIADSFDAMKSCRPYRKPLLFEEALEQIKTESGSSFDPEIAKLFTAEVAKDAI